MNYLNVRCNIWTRKAKGQDTSNFTFKHSYSTSFRSSWQCAKSLVGQYGIRACFSGFGAASLRNSCGATAYFYSYEYFKNKFGKFPQLTHTQQILSAGGISGAVYWLAIYPIDVAKSCMQCAAFTPKQNIYR